MLRPRTSRIVNISATLVLYTVWRSTWLAEACLIARVQNRRTDDPTEEDRSSSYSIKIDKIPQTEQPGPSKAYDWKTTSYRTKPR